MAFEKYSIFISLVILPIIHSVDIDYYFSSPLRSQKPMCKDNIRQFHCQLNCGQKTGVCIKEKCYCLSISEADEKKVIPLEYSKLIPINDGRPTLRHHIAHFCPNLDVARKCITKCMEEGKPAFCGKDHVCYCGHQYSNMDDNKKVNAKAMYSQFKDLYEKYFGVTKTGGSFEIDKN